MTYIVVNNHFARYNKKKKLKKKKNWKKKKKKWYVSKIISHMFMSLQLWDQDYQGS